MITYYGSQISPNKVETSEGILICRNVPIARIGQQDYLARELQLDGDPNKLVSVMRYEDDVFDKATLASFEGKPVTDGHPAESVAPENFGRLAKGHVQNVRREGDFIVADLHINDANLISDIQNGVKKEVSCGYLCNYEEDGDGYKQTHIRKVRFLRDFSNLFPPCPCKNIHLMLQYKRCRSRDCGRKDESHE